METVMTKAVAKRDIKILMEGGRFSNFIKGHSYRCMIKGNDVFLTDEDKYGYHTDLSDFHEDFEVVGEG